MVAIELPPACARTAGGDFQASAEGSAGRSFDAARLTKRFGPIVSGTQFVAG